MNNQKEECVRFNNDELNIILGALNCYIRKVDLPDDLYEKRMN